MNYEYEDENIHLKSIDGDIYLVEEDKNILLTKGIYIPHFTFISDKDDKIIFKYNSKFFYYDKKENIIIFQPLQHEDKGE